VNITPLYIFDLDGTLADLKHRRRFVTRSDDPARLRRKPDWDAFHAACVDDTPIMPVIQTFIALVGTAGTRADAWIWSGRMETVRKETEHWLHMEAGLHGGHYEPLFKLLKMRPANDYTPDDQLKESWLHAMSPEDRARLVMAFDDRDRVVAMWRRNGVVCAQVAPGDF
jgi:FMN phosphatase YigB (HAD superfamily)